VEKIRLMSFRVQVNIEAEEDLINIWASIAIHNPIAADKYVRLLGLRIDSLFEMPERGAMRDDVQKGLRMLVEGKYLIFYRVFEGCVEVLRVIHGSRDLTKIFN
jgi:toxin ParE1/3/4